MNIFHQQTTENLFELPNLSNLSFDIKLVPLDIKCLPHQEDLYFRQLNKAVRLVSSKISGPATLFWVGDKPHVAIPADLSFEDFVAPLKPMPVRVKMQPEVHHIRFDKCNEQEFELIGKLLDFSIRQQIKKGGYLIEEGTGRFIYKQPLKGFENNSVDLLHGFTFRLVPEGKEKLYLCLDITYRYVDKYYFSHYINGKGLKAVEKQLLGNHPNPKIGTRCLYEMGDWLFPIEVFSFSDNTAENELVTNKETNETMSLYDYLLKRTKNHRNNLTNTINRDDFVVYFKYPGKEMDYLSAPASLIRQIYKPDDRKIGKLHSVTIKETTERFGFIQSRIRNEFLRLKFNGKPLTVTPQLLDSSLYAFTLKDLKFSSGQLVKGLIENNGSAIVNSNYARQRKSVLQSVGVLKRGSLDDTQYLLVPDTLNFPKGLQPLFRRYFEEKANQLCPEFTVFKNIIPYQANKESVKDLVDEVARALEKEGVTSGYALIILPYWGREDHKVGLFHDFVKHHFKDKINFQCASGDKINSFFESKGQGKFGFADEDAAKKFTPYLFNLVLEYLKLNERYPYALNVNPNYDIYIGIDVHQQFAAFSFFYRNGENIKIEHLNIPKPPSKTRYEKLKAEDIYKVIYHTLKRHIPRYCTNPNGIVIVRDGSSHDGETQALTKTIQQLHTDGLINTPDLPCAVVDLHKRSQVPYRVGSCDSNQRQYDRPLAGTYRILGRNHEQAFLFPTGYPFQIRGSAKPLHFTLVHQQGDIALEKIIEDMLGQCLLAFSAPDRPNSLPIIIKLLDDYLAPFGYSQRRLDEAEQATITIQEEDDEDQDHIDAWNNTNFQQIDLLQ